MLALEITSSILKPLAPTGEREVEVVWMLTTTGKFTLSSAYQEVRQAKNRSFVFSQIWKPNLPFKVSFLMLRLLRGRLPLDEVLCKMGFQLPSNCFCCEAAEAETIEHAFFTGRLALEVWSLFNGTCGIVSQPQNLRACLLSWW